MRHLLFLVLGLVAIAAPARAQVEVFTNNCSTTLASGITSGATSLTVATGDGAKCPVTGSNYFWGTLQSGATIEIVKVTARATDTFTVTRAQQGTAAAAFAPGARFEQRLTSQTLSDLQTAKSASVLTETASNELTGEFVLGSLGTGLLRNTTTTGVPSIYAGTSCTNQFPRSLDASGAATCATVAFSTDTSGTVGVTRGGTGLTTTTAGDVFYADAANSIAKLAKNTTATRYLANTGTANIPAWDQVNLANGVTGILTSVNGGTGNGFAKFSGPTTAEKTFTLPDASATLITNQSGQVLNAPTVGIAGTSASTHLTTVGTAPTCAFTSGGGTSPSCTLETGSTDFAGIMTIATGTGSPGSSGTITLTFNASMGTNNPVCMATLASGATAWSVNSTVILTTQSKTAPVFSWTSTTATALVTLTTSTNYKIQYVCVSK